MQLFLCCKCTNAAPTASACAGASAAAAAQDLGATARDFGGDTLNTIRQGLSGVLDRMGSGLEEAQRAVAP